MRGTVTPVWIALSVLALAPCAGCRPRVSLEAPKEPIVINMNVKIDHEIRVKVDKDLEDAIQNDKEIF